MSKNSPVVIFGIGGSGTRIVAKVVRSAGYDLGKNVNPFEDTLDISFFLNRQANKYIVQSNWLNNQMERNVDEVMIRDFKEVIIKHKSDITKEKWGWKSPRSIYMLPFFHQQYPNMRAIHVVRDGRDMAYSDNQNQLKIHGPFILRGNQFKKPEPIQSITLWSIINLAALEYGEKHLKNYLCIRFEDLCQKPNDIVEKIFRFLDTPISYEIIPSILRPKTIGRWQKYDQSEIKKLVTVGKKALQRFRYLPKKIAEPIAPNKKRDTMKRKYLE